MRPSLRGYQASLVPILRDTFRRVRRAVLVLPTGGGKTVVAADLIDTAAKRGTRTLVLAHRKELIDQVSAKLDLYDVPHGVIKSGHPRHDLSHLVQVASVATLVRRIDTMLAPATAAELADFGEVPIWRQPFGLIVTDECHHVAARSYQRIYEAYPQAYQLGLTATPYRIDGKGLHDTFDELVIGATVPQLIREGFLVPSRTFAPPPPEALGQLRIQAGDFDIGGAADVLDRVGPVKEVLATWQRLGRDRLTVAFACTVDHAQHLADAFRSAGVAAAAVDGEMDERERARILADFARGELRVVTNVGLLTEGWDMPEVSCIIQARPTKSRSLWRQICGRGMRPYPGKADCLILDHAGNGLRFGTPNDAEEYSLEDTPREKRKREAGIDKNAICPKCQLLLTTKPPRCPGCGTALRAEEAMAPQRGELELIELSPVDEAFRYTFYEGVVRTAEDMGKRKGWAFHRYLERFGEKPQPWMPVKAGIYYELFGREPDERLVKIAEQRGNPQEVNA